MMNAHLLIESGMTGAPLTIASVVLAIMLVSGIVYSIFDRTDHVGEVR